MKQKKQISGSLGLPRSLVYRNGEKSHLIDTNQLVDEIETMVRQRVQELEEAKSKEIIRSSS